jgi:hypothetical protein
MSNLSRRALVTGAAGLPVLAAPALASSEPDPIFAAIEKYRRLDAAFLARNDLEDDLAEAGQELAPASGDHRTPEMVAAVNAAIDSRVQLARTPPTTPEGLAAYLEFVALKSDELGGFFFDSKYEKMTFIRSIAHASRLMVVS